MNEQERLEQAIAALEAQRATLGDSMVDAALGLLREKLADVEASKPAATFGPAERRVVTVLFCDVVGSTTIAEQMDPEAWTHIMNGAFERMNEVVARYGGSVAQLMGDAIAAFFGAPVAHEDDPVRAVLAGLGILESIRPYRRKLRREQGVEFNVRVGINTGLVVVGEMGSELYGEYTAMGDAVNLASRMEQTAKADTVQISGNTYSQVATLFEVESLGGIQVKGRSQPVSAYRVLGRKVYPDQLRGLEAKGLTSTMIGREAEMATINQRLDQLLSEGQGGLVLIFGEAGLGKSRLVGEVHQAFGGGLRWLEGCSLSYGQTLGYWPFREILQGFAGITEEDGEVVAWDKLEDRLTSLFGEEAADIVPYLATLLAMDVQEPYTEKVKFLDEEALGRQVYRTSRRFFEQLAKSRPLVLVLEDLHWMDGASGRLLEHLLPLVKRAPLLIVGLSRPETGSVGDLLSATANQNYAERYTEVRLTSLMPADSMVMLQNLLSTDDLTTNLRLKIIQQASGNPYFLEEIVRTLLDTGVIEKDPGTGRWRTATPIETLQLPNTIQSVVMARVDLLAEEVKLVLQTASVVGRSFLFRVLKAIVSQEREIDDDLATLQAMDLIQVKQRRPELEYKFKHALAQEAVYESILLQTRQTIHRRVAETIEELFTDRLEEFYGLLAYHFARAEVWEQALDYLLKAGDQAGQVAADDEALAHYHQALTAYGRAFGERWDSLQRATLERKIGQALFRRGEHEQALEYLVRAVAYLGRPLPSSRWGVRLELLTEALQQLLTRLAPRMTRKAGGPDDYPEAVERIVAYEALVWIDVVGMPERFMLDTLRALNTAERTGHRVRTIFGYMALSSAFVFLGHYWLSDRYAQLGLALAEDLNHPGSLGWVHQGLAMLASAQGNAEKSIEHSLNASQLYRETGFIRGWGAVTLLRVQVLVHQGQYAEARSSGEEVIDVGLDSGDVQLQAWGYYLRGLVQRYTGNTEAAVESLRRNGELADTIPDYLSRVNALTMIGHCYLQMAQLEPALTHLREARRILQERNIPGVRFKGNIQIGLAWAALLEVETGSVDGRDAILTRAVRACKAARKSTRTYRPFQAQAFRLQGTCDWLCGRRQQAERWWSKSLALADEIGQPYEKAMTSWEMGIRLEEPNHLENAKSQLAEIEARPTLYDPREGKHGRNV